MTIDEMEEKVRDYQKRDQAASNRRSQLEGSMSERLRELQELKTQIQKLGHDPAQLPKVIEDLEAEIREKMAVVESKLTQAEAALRSFEEA